MNGYDTMLLEEALLTAKVGYAVICDADSKTLVLRKEKEDE